MIDPPVLFVLQQKGFSKVLDIGSLVEMPVGGLTTLSKTIGGKPDQVRRVDQSAARSQGNFSWLQGKIGRVHRQDDENGSRHRGQNLRDYGLCLGRQRRADARSGMNNIIRGIQSQGRFAERKVAFEEIADRRLARASCEGAGT